MHKQKIAFFFAGYSFLTFYSFFTFYFVVVIFALDGPVSSYGAVAKTARVCGA